MTFQELVQEAIALSTAKQQYTTLDSSLYQDAPEAIQRMFGDKHRLIYPIEIDSQDMDDSELCGDIKDLLLNHNHTIISFDDYKRGIAYPIKGDDIDAKNPTKIGKLLTKYAPAGDVEVTDRETRGKKMIPGQPLLHAFKMDPMRQTTRGKYLVVISRHPYDIAGMSTDRNWTSCMDLGPKIEYRSRAAKQGLNAKYVAADVAHGSIIAYLVPASELTAAGKVTLRRPLSRILMKPHVSATGRAVYGMGRIYGVQNTNFSKFVEGWVHELNGEIDPEELFDLHPELYQDVEDRPVGFSLGKDVIDDSILMMLDPEQHGHVHIGRYTLGQKATMVPITYDFEYTGDRPLRDASFGVTSVHALPAKLQSTMPIVAALLSIFARTFKRSNRDPVAKVEVNSKDHIIRTTFDMTLPINRANAIDLQSPDMLESRLIVLRGLDWNTINQQFQDVLNY